MHKVQTTFTVKDANEIDVHKLFALGAFIRIVSLTEIEVLCPADVLDQVTEIVNS